MLNRRYTRGYKQGDTIVEVLFAITIFSLVAVAAMSLMNKGLATSQQSLELTAVRQQVDGQAESLRLLHSAYVSSYRPGATPDAGTLAGRYNTIRSLTVGQATEFGAAEGCALPSGNKFVVDPLTAEVKSANNQFVAVPDTYARIARNETTNVFKQSEGLYVQAVPSSAASSGGVGFIDFHIRACWEVLGSPIPMTIGTIVRLYEPAS